MTTRQYLNQADRLNRTINNKLAEVYQLKSIACGVGMLAEGEKVKTSGKHDKLGDAVSKIVDAEGEINRKIGIFIKKRDVIIAQIEEMEDDMAYQVLFSRYIEHKTFEQIANENNYSPRQIIRIHDAALEEFERKFGKNYKDVTKCH